MDDFDKSGPSSQKVVLTTIENASDSQLAGLGVSVYDQDEFEAGVIKRLDEEAARQNTNQQRKFVEKEIRDVQIKIRRVKEELAQIARSITLLLSRPLCDVVHKVKDTRARQETKKKQLGDLEEREKEMKRRLAEGDFEGLLESAEEDRPFSLPTRTRPEENERQRLISAGLLTPFGSSSEEKQVKQSSTSESASSRLCTPSPVALVDFDWLGVNDSARNESSTPQTSSRLHWKKGGIKGKGKASIASLHRQMKLAPEKGGLFSSHESHSTTHDSPLTKALTQNSLEPQSEDEYQPESGEEENSLYMSDEEEIGQRKKFKLRELSSEESDGDLVHTNWLSGRKQKKTVKRKRKIGMDDGNDEMYQLRIRQYEDSLMAENDPDMEFQGGFTIPGSIWQRLYRYQQTGVKWLWELHCQQCGGIVGDEMGLGKTIQMIAFLAGLKVSNLRSHVTRKLGLGPVLIVCPATVLHQWVREFHAWWPPFRVAVLHDTGSFLGNKKSLIHRLVAVDGVVVTTYASIRLYRDILLGQNWDYVILDEGHKIRNPDAEITITCKQFGTPHKIILSGSPMQNNLRELWSLFDFVFPGKLGTLPVFMEQFSVPITLGGYVNASQIQVQTAYRCACVLRDTINPYLLRRLKMDVKLLLPNKNEQVLFCRLTDYQRELYEDYLKGPEVEAMLSGRNWVFSGLTTMRKLCNHPDLVTCDYSQVRKKEGRKRGRVEERGEIGILAESSDPEDEEEEEFTLLNVKRTRTPSGNKGEDEETFGYWRRSGKMVVIESLLRLWSHQQHKVLLFTQSKQMLNILERFVVSQGYCYFKMDGGTSIRSRQPMIRKFNEDPSVFVFLLTTRVGGLGINLTGADRVVIYDPDWNPSTDIQAKERAWRIGQTRPVTIYRLLTTGTIEEKIYHRQIFKQFLTNRVLRDPRQRRFFKSNDLYELFTLDPASKQTETEAIFAGTGSEVKITRNTTDQKTARKRKSQLREKLVSERKHNRLKREQNKSSHQMKPVSESSGTKQFLFQVQEGILSADRDQTLSQQESVLTDQQSKSSVVTPGVEVEFQTHKGEQEQGESDVPKSKRQQVDESSAAELADTLNELEAHRIRHKKKHKKHKRHHRRKDVELEGVKITGLDQAGVFEPGSEDEEEKACYEQDNFILSMLFKKSGLQSAMQHDTIINGGEPDYVLVQNEADKVAKSAVRALKESRREVMAHQRWGSATWTGQSGVAGAPRTMSRFGQACNKTESASGYHFAGSSNSAKTVGTLNLSSSSLLAKMRSRNTYRLPEADGKGLHSEGHESLLKKLRDFVACQCREDGRASTNEILARFGGELSPSQSAVFRSMLRQICDFDRYHGEGIWTLKTEFR